VDGCGLGSYLAYANTEINTYAYSDNVFFILIVAWLSLLYIFKVFPCLSVYMYVCLKAIVMYDISLHFNPHCAKACNNLGVIYKDRDNLDKDVECYQVSCLYTVWFLIVFSQTSLFVATAR
jgi:hypothetical protein